MFTFCRWYPGEKIKWSNLNPQELLEKMAKIDLYGYVSVDVLQNMFDRVSPNPQALLLHLWHFNFLVHSVQEPTIYARF